VTSETGRIAGDAQSKPAIEVVGAVIVHDDQILVARRGPGGEAGDLWEFPGGKVEPGETPEQALVREIAEELGCEVEVGAHVTTTIHEYDAVVVSLSTYLCALVDGTPSTSEHAELAWVQPSELHVLEWAPADVPAVDILATR